MPGFLPFFLPALHSFLPSFLCAFLHRFLPSFPPLLAVISFWYEAICLFDAIYIQYFFPQIRGIHIHKNHFLEHKPNQTFNHQNCVNNHRFGLFEAVWGSVDLSPAPDSWIILTKLWHGGQTSPQPWGQHASSNGQSRPEEKFHGNQPLDLGLVASRPIQGWNFTKNQSKKKNRNNLNTWKTTKRVGGFRDFHL